MSFTSINQIIRERLETKNQVLEYADENRKAGIYTDICIKAGIKSFRAHRLILSCYSEYFRKMFQVDMQEKYADTVKIEGIDETCLELLIDFIYSGKICINQENVFDLLAASDYLRIEEAKQFCVDYLFDLISVETWFKVFKMADVYQHKSLLNTSFQFLNNKFAKISSKSDFISQSKQSLVHLLSQRDPYRVVERLVYDAIISWVKYDDSRKYDFAELFQRLDLIKLSTSFLTNTVLTEALVIENQLCSNLVANALTMKSQEPFFNNASKILSITERESPKEIFFIYNDDQIVYPALPLGFYPHWSLNHDNFVYCIAENSYLLQNKVFRMKISEANMKWEEVALMEVKRICFAAAVFRNGIAITGGWFNRASPATFYDFSLNKWLALPSMNEYRYDAALVTCNGCLFYLGGTTDSYDNDDDDSVDDITLSSVEMLCDVNWKWQYVQPMQTPRSSFAAVTCMDAIYAIGGFDNLVGAIKTVEKYDSDLNKWVYVKDMNFKRRGHSACVMQDKIFVVGGVKANYEFAYEIECYDPLSDKWSIVGNTNDRFSVNSIVAI